MSNELIATAVNFYFLPAPERDLTPGEDMATIEVIPMAELILTSAEPTYHYDPGEEGKPGKIVRRITAQSARVHVSLSNLDKHIKSLEDYRDQLRIMTAAMTSKQDQQPVQGAPNADESSEPEATVGLRGGTPG